MRTQTVQNYIGLMDAASVLKKSRISYGIGLAWLSKTGFMKPSMMKNKSKRGRADSEALPTIEELIEMCDKLSETIENDIKELKDEIREYADKR